MGEGSAMFAPQWLTTLPILTMRNGFLAFFVLFMVVRYLTFYNIGRRKPPVYGVGEPDLQAALTKGYEQVCGPEVDKRLFPIIIFL